jgi:hypothetical protein
VSCVSCVEWTRDATEQTRPDQRGASRAGPRTRATTQFAQLTRLRAPVCIADDGSPFTQSAIEAALRHGSRRCMLRRAGFDRSNENTFALYVASVPLQRGASRLLRMPRDGARRGTATPLPRASAVASVASPAAVTAPAFAASSPGARFRAGRRTQAVRLVDSCLCSGRGRRRALLGLRRQGAARHRRVRRTLCTPPPEASDRVGRSDRRRRRRGFHLRRVTRRKRVVLGRQRMEIAKLERHRSPSRGFRPRGPSPREAVTSARSRKTTRSSVGERTFLARLVTAPPASKRHDPSRRPFASGRSEPSATRFPLQLLTYRS